MTLTPVEFPRFGGLDFSVDPQEEGFTGAVDLLDVMFDLPGTIRGRDAISRTKVINTAGSSSSVLAMTYSNALGADDIYALVGDPVSALQLTSTFGPTTVRTLAGTGGATEGWFVEYGTPTHKYLVYTVDNASAIWANTSDTLHGLTVGGGPLGVTPWDNRLIHAVGDRVNFSDPDDPTTFTEFQELSPGDGEHITNVVTWRDFVFVFKQSKFFVFTSVTKNLDGSPIFNFRTVDVGHGAADFHGAVATSDGVYFVDSSGLWLTAGENPTKVSGRIDLLFAMRGTLLANSSAIPYTSTELLQAMSLSTTLKLTASNNHIIISTSAPAVSPTTVGTLAYHRPSKTWTAWSINAEAMCGGSGRILSIPTQDGAEDIYFAPIDGAASPTIYKMAANDQSGDTATSPNAGPVTCRWQSGLWNPGAAGAETNIFEWIVDALYFGATTSRLDVTGAGIAAPIGGPLSVHGNQSYLSGGMFARNFSVTLQFTQTTIVRRMIANISGQTQPGFQAI